MEEKTASILPGHQQFNLRWNNHANNILQVFMEQFTSDALTDVTIACEGNYIKAHKMVLSACSLYFQELFRIHVVKHPFIIMNGMKFIDLKQVIDFMYRGEVKVLETELDSLLTVAESLQVKGLSTVRNNYDKNDILEKKDVKEETSSEKDVPNISKKRKTSCDDDTSTKNNDTLSDSESLSSTIKIEPPEICDIDEEVTENKVVEEVVKKPRIIARKPKPAKRIIRPRPNALILPKTWQIHEIPKIPQIITTVPSVNKSGKESKIPRPPNAFMIFANEWRKKLASQYQRESNKEISVRLGLMWKNLSSDLKENYYSASRKADEEHKQKYPGYYYSPKEARMRKNLKVLDLAANKKTFDPSRLVKLVMNESNDNDTEGWSAGETSEEKMDADSELIQSLSSDTKHIIDIEDENKDDIGEMKIEIDDNQEAETLE